MILTICLTPAVGMINDNFLQTCIKHSLMYTKAIENLGLPSHSTSQCIYQLDHLNMLTIQH